jgi:hypothetical protein
MPDPKFRVQTKSILPGYPPELIRVKKTGGPNPPPPDAILGKLGAVAAQWTSYLTDTPPPGSTNTNHYLVVIDDKTYPITEDWLEPSES